MNLIDKKLESQVNFFILKFKQVFMHIILEFSN